MHVPSFTGIVTVQDLLDIGLSGAHPVDNSILLPAMMSWVGPWLFPEMHGRGAFVVDERRPATA